MSRYKPLKNWDSPRDGFFRVIKNCYWLIGDDGQPLVSAKHGTPQCSGNKAIAERLSGRGERVCFFDTVFMPIRVTDFDYVVDEP